MQTPSIGRIIRVVLRNAAGELIIRPAIITRTWGETPGSCVQAQVFTDGFNDGIGDVVPKSSLRYDEKAVEENTYHWPAR